MRDYYKNQTADRERVLRDIKDHRMQVIQDNGVFRHIRMAKPGTMNKHVVCLYEESGFSAEEWAGPRTLQYRGEAP